MHQATARGDQGQRVFKRKNSGQTRGHVFAHAVADHRLGLSAPAHPELRQCILDDKQRRLREEGLAQLLGRLLKFVRLRIKNGTQVKFQMRLENLAAAVYLFPEHRLGLVKLAAHAHLLGALAGKHESDTGLLLARLSVENAFRVAPGQRLHRLRDAAAECHPPMAEGLSAGLQSKGDVGQIDFGIFPEVFRQIRRGRFERGFCFRREQQELPGAGLTGWLGRGRLFEHNVRVRPADAK